MIEMSYRKQTPASPFQSKAYDSESLSDPYGKAIPSQEFIGHIREFQKSDDPTVINLKKAATNYIKNLQNE